MNGFVRTMAYGFAAMFLLLISAGVTTLVALRAQGKLDAKVLREAVLTPEESAWLQTMRERGAEPAPAPADEQAVIERIAELASARQANQLVVGLRLQRQSLDERALILDQREAEIRVAAADLERLNSEHERRQRLLVEAAAAEERRRQEWAALQVAAERRITVLSQVEIARARELARMFETQRDEAWRNMRESSPREIARYLAFMDPKRAARILVLAQQDREKPDLYMAVQQAYLKLDLDGLSGDQIAHLAELYQFMEPEAVVGYLRERSPQEIADVLRALKSAAKRGQIIEALRRENARLQMDVLTLLGEANGEGAAR